MDPFFSVLAVWQSKNVVGPQKHQICVILLSRRVWDSGSCGEIMCMVGYFLLYSLLFPPMIFLAPFHILFSSVLDDHYDIGVDFWKSGKSIHILLVVLSVFFLKSRPQH